MPSISFLYGKTLSRVGNSSMSEIIATRATSRRGPASLEVVRLRFFTGEVEDHGGVFVAFAAGPGLGDVIFVLEAKDEVMLLTDSRSILRP
jgi:hypothetical protein